MSACPSLSYAGVSTGAWDAIKAAVLEDYHITIPSDAGQDSGDGFQLSWAYDPTAKTLTIDCLDSPWWAACSTINSTIDGLVRPLMAANP